MKAIVASVAIVGATPGRGTYLYLRFGWPRQHRARRGTRITRLIPNTALLSQSHTLIAIASFSNRQLLPHFLIASYCYIIIQLAIILIAIVTFLRNLHI